MLPQWAANTAARYSSAVRAALVLDMVGIGGGIGQQLMNLLSRLDVSQLSVALILTVLTLLVVDVLTRQIGQLLGQP